MENFTGVHHVIQQAPECYRIRNADKADMEEIQAIYGYYVHNTVITFEETPPSVTEMEQRFDAVKKARLPYLVADDPGGPIAGYAYAVPYRPRRAYRFTVEESVYLHPDFCGRGIGKVLLGELIGKCGEQGYKEVLAVITGDDGTPSCRFHEQCGFEAAGVLRNVGYKHGQWLDTIFMQRHL